MQFPAANSAFSEKYPPTPALAKAGAAPGTTEGVEPCVLPPARKTPVQPRHSTFSSHGILLFRASGVPFGSVHRVQVQQVPEAVPVSFYGASRLPFTSPETRLQLDYRPNATPATAISPRQTLCTFKQSLRPCQCHFIALQGCRLPSLKRACSSITAQTPLLPQQSLRGRPCALPSSP